MAKILVVDDDKMSLKRAEFILGKDGSFETTSVDSGAAALAYLSENTVDVVLLDVEMPQMSGIETLKQIRANAGLENLKVIFLTATIDAETTAASETLHVAAQVKKPFMPDDLIGTIKSILA